MSKTSVALLVRQQAWFRSFVDSEVLESFPLAMVNSVALKPVNVVRARVLIGRGPLNQKLQPEFSLWFGNGVESYPVFQCPSIGPLGAELHGRTRAFSITASDQEALCLIEVSVVRPVGPDLLAEYSAEQQQHDVARAGRRVLGPANTQIQHILGDTKKRLEQAIGLYALYQYPLVWEPVGMGPFVAFVNLETQTCQQITPLEFDNFIPFRLDAKDKIQNGCLLDDGLVDLHRLEGADLHVPLMLFQRALWQRHVQVRFLEMFWVIEHIAGQFAGSEDERLEREDLFRSLQEFVWKERPQHKARLDRLKGLFVQPALSQRLAGYLSHHGIAYADDIITRMVQLRNNLSHAGHIDSNELAAVELETRVLVRKVMRAELAKRGVGFGRQAM